MVGSFYHFRRYLTPAAILYAYKCQIKLKREYRCYIWAGASQSSHFRLNRAYNAELWVMNYSSPCNPYSTCERLPFTTILLLLQQVLILQCHQLGLLQVGPAIFMVANHLYSLCVPLIKIKFQTNNFLKKNVILWNKFFPDNYNLVFFRSRVNQYFSYSSS